METVFLNHHPVWKNPLVKDKIRVVFNGSSPDVNGNSLNDTLYSGPAIQSDLSAILLNFRLYPIAVIADIKQMYRQILIQPEQQDLQRIL